MSIVNKAIFGAIMAATVAGLDYYLFLQKNNALLESGGVPYAGYVDSVKQRIGAAVGPAQADPAELTSYLPAAPTGWERRRFRSKDGEVVTGRVFRSSMVSIDTTNDILEQFGHPQKPTADISETYAAGDTRVIVKLTYRAPKASKSLTGQISAEVSEGLDASDPQIFGVVKGVVFRQGAQTNRDTKTGTETPVDYRRFRADICDSVDILVMTNAADAEVQSVLGAIDLPGLAIRAGLPGTMVNNDLPVVWGEAAYPEAEAALERARAREVAAAAATPAPTSVLVRKNKQQRGAKETATISDRAKPAKGTCVRKAGKLVCEE